MHSIATPVSANTAAHILANPAKPRYGVRGVNDPLIMERTARIMKNIGYERAVVLYGFLGEDTPGMDEASTLGRTVFTEITSEGKLKVSRCYPEDFGIHRGKAEDIAAFGDPVLEAQRLARILSGEKKDPCSDIVFNNCKRSLCSARSVHQCPGLCSYV